MLTIAALFLASIFVSGGLMWYSNSQISELKDERGLATQIEADMLMLRRNEKDFLMRTDKKYLDKFEKNFAAMEEHVEQILQISSRQHMDAALIVQIQQILREYRDTFRKLVAVQEKIGFDHKSGLNGQLRDAVHNAEEVINELKNDKLLSQMLMLRRREKDFMLRDDPKYIDKFNKDFAKMTATLMAEKLPSKARSLIQEKMEAYSRQFLAYTDGAKEKGLSSEQGLRGEMRNTVHKTETSLEQLFIQIEEFSAAKINRSNTISIVLGLTLALLSLGFIVSIARGILKPLNAMMHASDDLHQGDGDLTYRLPDFGHDEFGQTAKSLNGFIEKIQVVLEDVSRGIEAIANASSQVNETAGSLSQSASEQAASVEETSASLEEMGSSIDQNAENAKVTNEMARSAATKAQEGGKSVAETVLAMNEVAEKVSLIEDIAYKTNLLALNAAIEAARAGEHGKGFAVVADEVRKLAERSQISAQEITELTTKSASVAKRAGDLLNEIVPAITKTSTLVDEISLGSNEQRAGITQVNQAVSRLERVAQTNAASSEELSSTSHSLKTEADQLKYAIGFFKLS